MSQRPVTWVLLRGLAREAGHWGPFVDALAAAQPGARVITIDTPGNGRRRDTPVPDTLEGSMEQVRADLEAAAPAATRGPTFVFAMSMGGMIALAWAKAHPGELAGVVVGNTSVGGLSPFWKRMRPGVWPALFANLMRQDIVEREASILRMVVNDPAARAAAHPLSVEVMRARPNRAANARAQLTAAARFRAPAAPLSPPLLVLTSDGDRLCHADCSRAVAKLYGAPIEVHDHAGHDLGWDAPAWTIDKLVAFARRHATAP